MKPQPRHAAQSSSQSWLLLSLSRSTPSLRIILRLNTCHWVPSQASSILSPRPHSVSLLHVQLGLIYLLTAYSTTLPTAMNTGQRVVGCYVDNELERIEKEAVVA
jgi:hypothetical protein